MSAAVGKLQNSLTSLNFEYTVVLLNSVSTSAEWKWMRRILIMASTKQYPIKDALMRKRGSPHVTLRRLRTLLGDKIPDDPLLLDAYRMRATEIAQYNDALRSGQTVRRYGVFQDFTGPDATTIRAAATSGKRSNGYSLVSMHDRTGLDSCRSNFYPDGIY